MNHKPYDAVIIGAGQSGLAAAYHLQQAKLNFVMLESSDALGGAWRHYFDSLTLFSPAKYSSLPDFPLASDPDHYPTRDEIVAYLEAYAEKYQFPVKTNANVVTIEKSGEIFLVQMANGESVQSQAVIVATGGFNNPKQLLLPEQEQFQGTVLHAIDYANPKPFLGQRIVIVGSRNTAVQIGTELAQVASVTLASREPISFMSQHIMNRDIHYWLDLFKLDGLPLGQWFNFSSKTAVLDDGHYKTAVRSKQPDRRPMFTVFTKDGVVWSDGEHEKIDTVIYATGYQPNLPFLNDLTPLDDTNFPNQKGGVSKTVAGLYFVGLPWQRSLRSATLRGSGPDAAYVVQHLKARQTRLASER